MTVAVWVQPAACTFGRLDWDLLRAAAVTRGWNGYRIKSAEKSNSGGRTNKQTTKKNKKNTTSRGTDLSISSPAQYH